MLGVAGVGGFKVDDGIRLAGHVEHEVGAQLAERVGGGFLKHAAGFGQAFLKQLGQVGHQLHAFHQPPHQRVVEAGLPGQVVAGFEQGRVKGRTEAQGAGVAAVGAGRVKGSGDER